MLIPAASCRFCVLDKRNMKAVAIWNWSFAFGIGVWGCISIMFGSLFLFVSFFFLPAQLSTTSENISLMLGFHCFKNMFKLCIAKATVIAIAQVMKILNPVHCFHNIRFLNMCNFTKYGSLFNDAFWTLFLCSSHKISTIHAIFNSNFFPSFGKVALSSVSMPLSLLWSNSAKHSVIFSVLGYLARCHCLLEFIGRKDSISIFFFIFRHFSPLFWLNFMFLATLWKRGSV